MFQIGNTRAVGPEVLKELSSCPSSELNFTPPLAASIARRCNRKILSEIDNLSPHKVRDLVLVPLRVER